MPEINDQFVDVYFPDDPNYVFGDQGCPTFGDYPVFEDAERVMEESEIREAVEKVAEAGKSNCDLVQRIHNQRNEGSCVGQAGTAGVEVLMVEQLGPERFVPIGAQSLYKQIGRSPNSGATISSALRELTETGCLPLDTAANRERFGNHVMPDVGFHTRWPSDWKNTARKFRVSEFFAIRSVQGLKTALVCGHPVVVGRQGHSILYLDLLRDRNRWVVKYVNSWGSWGDGHGQHSAGFGYDTESQIRQSASWAFAIRGITAPADTN